MSSEVRWFQKAYFSKPKLENFQNINYFVFQKLYGCTRHKHFFRTGVYQNAGVLETAKDDVCQHTLVWLIWVPDKILEFRCMHICDFWPPDTTVNITFIQRRHNIH